VLPARDVVRALEHYRRLGFTVRPYEPGRPRRSVLRLHLLGWRRATPDAGARPGPEGQHLRLLHLC